MKSFAKNALLLFIALRAGDIINLIAGMWFVPKYIAQENLGALLPLTSFATFLSLPVFALAMTIMKEAACLAVDGEYGKIKSLFKGVYLFVAIMAIVVLIVIVAILPWFLKLMQVDNSVAGFLVITSAFLGCVAPIWTDSLQALKRFKSLAVIEILSSTVRFFVMLILMPLRALCGYFAAQVALPAFRIFLSILALRKNLLLESKPFWSISKAREMFYMFLGILAYQAIPLFVSMLEHSILRISLSHYDSAGYYMISRFSDILFYISFPLLLVIFPYAAMAAKCNQPVRHYAVKCSVVVLISACVLAVIYFLFGNELLSLLPNGAKYSEYARYMPYLTIITALTTCQVFFTNVEVSRGSFRFLIWFIPLNIVYVILLYLINAKSKISSIEEFIYWFAAIGILRFLFAWKIYSSKNHC